MVGLGLWFCGFVVGRLSLRGRVCARSGGCMCVRGEGMAGMAWMFEIDGFGSWVSR